MTDSSEEVNIVLCQFLYFLSELRCYDAFGYEFFSSSMCARVIYAMPLALDAVAVVGARRGQVKFSLFFPFHDFVSLCILVKSELVLLMKNGVLTQTLVVS